MDTKSIHGRLEIKPSRAINVQSTIIYLFMMVLSAFLIYSLVAFDNRITFTRYALFIIGGILSFLSTFWLTIKSLLRVFQNKSYMALSEKGIELYKSFGTVLIHWKNIAAVGPCGDNGDVRIGIKLRSYDQFLAHFPPSEEAKIIRRRKIFHFTNSILCLTFPVDLADKTRKASKVYKSVQNLSDDLRWSRETYGFDITISEKELDRPDDFFIQLLEEYLKEFGNIHVHTEYIIINS